MTKVSVILPNYNHAKFLKKRIECILNQTFTDFELIILDDASTDQSLEIIDSFSNNSKISHIFKNSENSKSTFKQWVKGFNAAKGKYIWIAESDDLADLNFLETHVEFLEKNPNFGISFSPSIWLNETGEVVNEPGHESEPIEKDGTELLKKDFLKGPIVYNASSAVFKSSLIKNVDLDLLQEFSYTGDWYFWSAMSKNSKVARQKDRLNYFRRHQNNVSSPAEKKGLGIIEGLKIIKKILEENKLNAFQKSKIKAYWIREVLKSPIKNKLKYMFEFMKL